MNRLILIACTIFLIVAVSIAAQFPPDYDYDYAYIHDPPTELSAGWSGADAYVSWNKTKDKFGDYASGYRLYRAADQTSPYVLIGTDEQYELITTAYYTDTASQLSAAGIYQSSPFYYKVTAAVLKTIDAAAGTYSLYESNYSAPVEVVRDSDVGCFIATAVFGSSMADEVKTLCLFRDRVLVRDEIGSKLVSFYYKVSPPVADFIREKPLLKYLTRLYLKPIIMLAKMSERERR